MINKNNLFGILAIIFLMSILFFPQGSNKWQGLLFIGIIFGGLWKFGK